MYLFEKSYVLIKRIQRCIVRLYESDLLCPKGILCEAKRILEDPRSAPDNAYVHCNSMSKNFRIPQIDGQE